MAHRKRQQEHENHERWLVSYADFITLLFAFFVVMYSLSSVNEGKYRILSESLEAAFRAPARAMEPVQVGNIARSPFEIPPEFRKTPSVLDINYILRTFGEEDQLAQLKHTIKAMAKELKQAMAPLIDDDLVNIRSDDLWIEVEIKTSILFSSGSAGLAAPAKPILQRLAIIVKNYPNRIHVEGFTDNIPIRTRIFPSNWELSAARAATVVRLLAQSGVDPSRMVAMGYGEYRPKADNSTLAGRVKNRRVVVTILADVDKQKSTLPGTVSDKLIQELSPSLENLSPPTPKVEEQRPAVSPPDSVDNGGRDITRI